MIDSHCHLDDLRFRQDLPDVLARAHQHGVERFIIAGVRQSQWAIQDHLKRQYTGIFNAFGVHPWFCHEHSEASLQILAEQLHDAVAVGECGLDFMPNRPPQALQIQWFQWQIDLAEQHHLPLIIHTVKSADTVFRLLKSHPSARGVIHGFSGSMQQAEQFMRLGFYIGIGTRAMHPRAKKIQQLAQNLPLSAMLLESDAPDGSPDQQLNEPYRLAELTCYLAKLRNQHESTIVAACTHNSEELFQL